MSHSYDDIIDLPHHVSPTHTQMSVSERAAQFAPFAALSGFGAVINETGRLTQQKIELDEDEKSQLNAKLNRIRQQLSSRPQLRLTYFQADEKKSGGAYLSISGALKKIDDLTRTLTLEDGTKIAVADIIAIEDPNETDADA